MERLSSGQRINSAADDAAGLAVANKMESQHRGIKMAMRNSRDGISLVQTAESGMTEITNMVLRMRELAVQMDNGVYTSVDRDNAQLEINALLAEIDKIAANTRFNDVALLDGSYDQTIRSGNTNAETTRIKLESMFIKDNGSGASINAGFATGPELTSASDYNTNFSTSVATQLGISATAFGSLAASDSEAILAEVVSDAKFRARGENVLLLKDNINSIGYNYAAVSLTDNQWDKVSLNLIQTKALYDEVEGLDSLETSEAI
jgi:flagellin